jgi:hypothetical protein
MIATRKLDALIWNFKIGEATICRHVTGSLLKLRNKANSVIRQ